MAIKGYVSATEIVQFMKIMNSSFDATDINELMVNAMYEFINSKCGGAFEVSARELFIDGSGDSVVWSPFLPIVSINEIARVAQDGTETYLIPVGLSRNVWWDADTGRIWTTAEYEGIEYGIDSDSFTTFPDRPRCVRVYGTFGQLPSDLVKQLQLFLILKQYSILAPGTYATDIIEEKIGRYSYKLANASNVAPENQRKGIDGWIAYLMEQLPNDSAMCLETI